jgi:Zn-dependent protease
MLGWSINLFRIRGIAICLNFSFLLVLAYVANEGWQSGGMPGLTWSVALFLTFFLCVVLHELGHSFTAMRLGIGVRRIVLMIFGGVAEFTSIPRRPLHEFLITAAGPAVNFAIAGVLWGALGFPAGWDDGNMPATVPDLLRLVAEANIFMGLFNLLPAFPMDGGRILRAILATRLPYLKATFWAATLGKVVTVLGIAVALYAQWYRLAGLFFFIFIAGESEYRAVRRREADEARWAAYLRIQAESAPAEEPPLLSSPPG